MALNLTAEIIIVGLHNQKQYHFPNVTFLREQGLYNLLNTEADPTVIFFIFVLQHYHSCISPASLLLFIFLCIL